MQRKYSVYASNGHATYIVIHYRGMSVRIPAFFGYMHLAPHRNMCCFSQFTCTYCIEYTELGLL